MRSLTITEVDNGYALQWEGRDAETGYSAQRILVFSTVRDLIDGLAKQLDEPQMSDAEALRKRRAYEQQSLAAARGAGFIGVEASCEPMAPDAHELSRALARNRH